MRLAYRVSDDHLDLALADATASSSPSRPATTQKARLAAYAEDRRPP